MIKLANKSALASILGGDEGMEKKALSLAALLRMSRNAANKGKLSRFSELLDKRNLAIDNVAKARRNAASAHWPTAHMESNLLGHYNGPEMKTRQRLVNRLVAAHGDPNDIERVIIDREKSAPYYRATAELDLSKNVAGPWTLKDLAKYSIRQLATKSNPIDKQTYPGTYPGL